MRRGPSDRRNAEQAGVSLLAVALAGSVMFSLTGLAIDLGRAFIIRSELQTFADTAALAAVTRLDGTQSGVQAAHALATAGPLSTSAPNGVHFGSTSVSGATDTYATTYSGSYVSYGTASGTSTNNYRFVQVAAGNTVSLYFLSLVPGIGSQMTVSTAATAGQQQQTGNFSNGGIVPFGVLAHSPANTINFGLTTGVKYTLKWGNHDSTTCAGDAGFTPANTPSSAHGFLDIGEGNGTSSLRSAIEYSGYPNSASSPTHVAVGDFVNEVTGNRGSSIFSSLSNRSAQDSDQTSTTWAQYKSANIGNGRRIITVIVTDSAQASGNGSNYHTPVLGFGNFFLDPANSISGSSGPICGTYIGPASTSGWGSGGTNGAAIYKPVLFR